MMGHVLLGLVVLFFLYLLVKSPCMEPFATKNSPISEDISYISCVAFDRLNKNNKERTDTEPVIERAPFWSQLVTGNNKEKLLYNVLQAVQPLAVANEGVIQGPAYLLLGRNKQTKEPQGWVYLPSMGKDELPVSTVQMYSNHLWLRGLLFSSVYAVTDWLCNNSCDMDRAPLKYTPTGERMSTTTKTYTPTYSPYSTNLRYIPTSEPDCGCISNKKCPFYNLPWKFSAKPRNMDEINSYSVYKLTPAFFRRAQITMEGSMRLEINRAPNGTKMYEGCETRLLSNNRLYALELDAEGLAVYETKPEAPFHETCVKKPGQSNLDSEKILRTRYNIDGRLPRLEVNDEVVGISSVNWNPSTRRNEWLQQWSVSTDNKNPYTLYLDDTGEIQLMNKDGQISTAKFESPST